MDKLSQPLDNYLKLAHASSLLVSKADMANLDILLSMLGTIDKDIVSLHYGLFGFPVSTHSEIAARYRLKPDAIDDIVVKDIHRIAITPEWQLMLRQLPLIVRKRIEKDPTA